MDRMVGGSCRLTALAANCPGVPNLDVTLLDVLFRTKDIQQPMRFKICAFLWTLLPDTILNLLLHLVLESARNTSDSKESFTTIPKPFRVGTRTDQPWLASEARFSGEGEEKRLPQVKALHNLI